jgi:hypothetical protein
MSKNVMIALIYHRHKLLDHIFIRLIYWGQFAEGTNLFISYIYYTFFAWCAREECTWGRMCVFIFMTPI